MPLERRHHLQVVIDVAFELDLLATVFNVDQPYPRVICCNEELLIVQEADASNLSSRSVDAASILAVNLRVIPELLAGVFKNVADTREQTDY